MTESVGLRELRQDASEIIRRVERGEEIEITVAGRPAARLVPIVRRQWLSWREIADVFNGQADPDWEADRDRVDQALTDPWLRDS